MTYAVTGTSGRLGRLAVGALLRRGVPADQIVAVARRTETLGDLAATGVDVRHGDYDDRASLTAAFSGVERLLLVSGTAHGQRARQHAAAVDAAERAGVRFVAYTSIARADSSGMALAQEHLETERTLDRSRMAHAVLRNGWYVENYTSMLPLYLKQGIAGAAGDGQVSAATRADLAEAAAAVLTGDGHDGAVYELGGEPFTMTELAAAVSAAAGRHVGYTDMSVEQYIRVLVGAGVPERAAAVLADGDRAVARGDLLVDGRDLEKLLGRPATPLLDAVEEAVRALHG